MKSAILPILSPKDRRPIYDWARDYYVFTPPLTKTDPLRIEECRHFQAPFDSLFSDSKREVSIRAPVRSAKTMLGEIFVAWQAVNDPGECMWVTGKASLADQEWEPGKLDESYGRIGDYLRMGISKVLNISQGGTDESDWDRIWRQGHCAEWEVQCLGCGQYFRPDWTHDRNDGQRAGMRWDKCKDDNGFWVIQKCLDSILAEWRKLVEMWPE